MTKQDGVSVAVDVHTTAQTLYEFPFLLLLETSQLPCLLQQRAVQAGQGITEPQTTSHSNCHLKPTDYNKEPPLTALSADTTIFESKHHRSYLMM